jgi:hypothetical protein
LVTVRPVTTFEALIVAVAVAVPVLNVTIGFAAEQPTPPVVGVAGSAML